MKNGTGEGMKSFALKNKPQVVSGCRHPASRPFLLSPLTRAFLQVLRQQEKSQLSPFYKRQAFLISSPLPLSTTLNRLKFSKTKKGAARAPKTEGWQGNNELNFCHLHITQISPELAGRAPVAWEWFPIGHIAGGRKGKREREKGKKGWTAAAAAA